MLDRRCCYHALTDGRPLEKVNKQNGEKGKQKRGEDLVGTHANRDVDLL